MYIHSISLIHTHTHSPLNIIRNKRRLSSVIYMRDDNRYMRFSFLDKIMYTFSGIAVKKRCKNQGEGFPARTLAATWANLPWKFKEMLALLSPKLLKALQRYWPPSALVGFRISKVSRYVSLPVDLRDILMRVLPLMALVPWNQVISGTGCASSIHSIMRMSPSCLIVGFFGKRGGLPSGILGARGNKHLALFDGIRSGEPFSRSENCNEPLNIFLSLGTCVKRWALLSQWISRIRKTIRGYWYFLFSHEKGSEAKRRFINAGSRRESKRKEVCKDARRV